MPEGSDKLKKITALDKDELECLKKITQQMALAKREIMQEMGDDAYAMLRQGGVGDSIISELGVKKFNQCLDQKKEGRDRPRR